MSELRPQTTWCDEQEGKHCERRETVIASLFLLPRAGRRLLSGLRTGTRSKLTEIVLQAIQVLVVLLADIGNSPPSLQGMSHAIVNGRVYAPGSVTVAS